MKPVPFGQTGISIPPIVYGTSFLGNLYRKINDDVKFNIMQNWFAAGSSPVCIDTAGKYGAGLALEVIGKGLSALGIDPEHIIMSNKLGWYRVPLTTDDPTFEPGIWADLQYDAIQKISYQGILDCYEQGCQLLGGKYKPQLVSVHDPDEYLAEATDPADREQRKQDIRDAYQALFELRDRGQIAAIGIGAKDWLVIRELYTEIPFDWVMLANSLTLFRHPAELLEFVHHIHKNGVGIINSAIFNAGFLTGGNYFDYRKIDPSLVCDQDKLKWRTTLYEVCEHFKVNPGDACMHFAWSPPEVQAIALNPSKPERIRQNVDILQSPPPVSFWTALKEKNIIHKDYPYV